MLQLTFLLLIMTMQTHGYHNSIIPWTPYLIVMDCWSSYYQSHCTCIVIDHITDAIFIVCSLYIVYLSELMPMLLPIILSITLHPSCNNCNRSINAERLVSISWLDLFLLHLIMLILLCLTTDQLSRCILAKITRLDLIISWDMRYSIKGRCRYRFLSR